MIEYIKMTKDRWEHISDIERIEYEDSDEGQIALMVTALAENDYCICSHCGQPVRTGYVHYDCMR